MKGDHFAETINLCVTVSHKRVGVNFVSGKDLRAQKSRAALRSAMLSMLETVPFEQITVRDIAREAEKHYATFFRHYPTKEALLEDLAREEMDQLMALTLPALNSGVNRTAILSLCGLVRTRIATSGRYS